VVEKSDLLKIVWPDSFVDEINLTVHISMLRKALGDNPNQHKYIATVPKRGYSFVEPVNELASPEVKNEDVRQVSVPPVKRPGAGNIPSSSLALNPGKFFRMVMPALLLTAIIYLWAPSRSRQNSETVLIKSIAVLPFKTLNSPNLDYMGVGMADALITRLSNMKNISVRPTDAVLKYNGTNQDIHRIGDELQVDLLLSGFIQRSGDDIRLTVQLIRAEDGTPVWADKFEESFTNVFAVEDSLSQQMADILTMKLTDYKIILRGIKQ
jgi:TolB-like protein